MFSNLLAVETRKLMKRPMLWIELGMMALFVVLIFTMLYVVSQQAAFQANAPASAAGLATALRWPRGLLEAMNLASGNGLGGLLLIVLAGAGVAQDCSWRTLHLLVGRGAPRATLLLAKFVALLIPVLLVVAVALISGGAITALFSLHLDGSLHAEQVQLGQVALDGLRIAYTLLPYVGLAFLLAVISRSVAVAIGGALAYTLLLEGVLAQLLMQFSTTLSGVERENHQGPRKQHPQQAAPGRPHPGCCLCLARGSCAPRGW